MDAEDENGSAWSIMNGWQPSDMYPLTPDGQFDFSHKSTYPTDIRGQLSALFGGPMDAPVKSKPKAADFETFPDDYVHEL